MIDRKASILAEAAEIAMDGWHSVEKAKAFACSVSDYLLALTSAPAEPPDRYTTVYNAWALLKAERVDEAFAVLSKLVGHTPAETPPAAGAIDARGQSITKADVLRVAKEIGLVGWISDCGQWFEFTDTQHPSKLLIQFAEHYAALASRSEAPAAAGAALAVAREALIDLIEEHLHGVYHCGRVWEAWSVGTMSRDDFTEARGSDLAPDIADALLSKFGALAGTPAPEAAETVRMPSELIERVVDRLRKAQIFSLSGEVDAALKAAQPIEREDGK